MYVYKSWDKQKKGERNPVQPTACIERIHQRNAYTHTDFLVHEVSSVLLNIGLLSPTDTTQARLRLGSFLLGFLGVLPQPSL